MKSSNNIFIAFILNFGFSILEIIGGLFTNSATLLSDALHNFVDALSVGISYLFERKSQKSVDDKHAYGYVRYSTLGGAFITILLLAGSAILIKEAIERIIDPTEVNYQGMLIFAIVGIIVHAIATYVTHRGDSINQKSVNLHMLSDTLSWIAILIGCLVMHFTGITIIDPIMSIGIAVFIIFNALKNAKIILDIFLEKTPKNVNPQKIQKALRKIDGVTDVHHFHVRSLDGTNNYATLHVVVQRYSQKVKQQIKDELVKQNVHHSTIELELKDETCNDHDCEPAHLHTHHH